MRRLLTVCLTVAASGAPALTPATASPAGAGQVVAAVPETVFGFAVGADAPARSGSTIPVQMTSERIGDTVVVTLAPRE